MIEFDVKHINLIERESELQDVLREDEPNYDDKIQLAKSEVLRDLRNNRWEVRKLGTTLSLQSSVSKDSAFTGNISNEDEAERMKLIIKVTSGSGIFVLQGTNDGGTTYDDVLTVQADSTGRFSAVLTAIYKKYRLKKVDSNSTTYSAYLTDDIYDELVILRSLMYVFEDLINSGENRWLDKLDRYTLRYENWLANGKFVYDEDDDGTIDDEEAGKSMTDNITWKL